MDDVDLVSTADVDGDAATDETVSNGDLANRRRRQQVRQACQQCRRRKIKCDEVRPVCRPCVKARLACAYELPPGQTRAQAMLESQQRLRDELNAHTSLIHCLRSVDTDASVQMLGRLRRGDYDSALLGIETPSKTGPSGDKTFPWEEAAGESRRHGSQDSGMMPQLDGFRPGLREGDLFPLPQSRNDKPGFHYNPVGLPPQPYSPNFAPPHGMSSNAPMMDGASMHGYGQRMPTYQQQDMQYRVHNPAAYQQDNSSHQSTLPSNDPHLTYAGSR